MRHNAVVADYASFKSFLVSWIPEEFDVFNQLVKQQQQRLMQKSSKSIRPSLAQISLTGNKQTNKQERKQANAL